MAPDLDHADEGVFWRTMFMLVPFDLAVGAAFVATWLLLGIIDIRVAVFTAGVRAVVWIVHLRSSLAPVRICERQLEACSDAQVLAGDAALQRLARRFSLVYAGLWVGCQLSWVVAAVTGVPVEVGFGGAELVAALMFCVAALGVSSLVHMLLESASLDVRARIGAAVIERRLRARRPPSSITRPVVAAAMQMLLGGMLAVGGISIVWNAHSLRKASVVEQQLLAELSATRVGAGLGEALAGVEIVELEALPAPILAELESRGLADAAVADASTESVAVHDIGLGLAIAAAGLGDGRWAVSKAAPDVQLGVLGGLLLLVIFAALPLFGIGFRAFSRTISTPLERFSEAAQQFVERGELQALERIVPLRNDELGRLATNFNGMLDILEQLTRAAAAVSAGDLTIELEHPGELHDAFRGMLVRLSETVVRLRETSLELASAAAEINALTAEQEQAAQMHSGSVQQVSVTVASLAASAQQVADAAQGVLHDAEQAVATTDATADKIGELRGDTSRISELLEHIREIADRSDLLALNGSLEATRAGEAGRGFSLVAAEMRRLAERVTGTVDDVRERVADIEVSSASTVFATEDSRKLAQRTAAAAREISTVTARQSRDTEEVARGVQSVAEVVAKATLAVSQTRAAAEGLRAHAAELERLIATFEVRGDEVLD